MTGLIFRPYSDGDKAACMDLFMSNTPRYFGVEEAEDFRKFLDAPVCDFFVVTQNDELVACGGHGYHDKKDAFVLAWGMVRADLHKHGLGKFLLAERLKRIYKDSGESLVKIETSQHSRGFFERFGFVVTNTIENYFAPGIDRVDMELRLTAESNRSLLQQEIG
jgi:predicted GNAT family N-acyltransferase